MLMAADSNIHKDAEIAAIDTLLEEALTRLDDIERYDVSAHVDLALHRLRGKRNVFYKPPENSS
jgi:hypothetical protein